MKGAWRGAAITAVLVLALLVLSFVLSTGVFQERELSESFVRSSFAEELLPLAVFAVAAIAFRRSGRILTAAALLLLIAERHVEMKGVYPSPGRVRRAASHVSRETPAGSAPFRIVARDDILRPNASTFYGLEDVRGYAPFTLAEVARIFLSGAGPGTLPTSSSKT